MAADVYLWRLPRADGADLAPPDLESGLRKLVGAAAAAGIGSAGGRTVLKVHLGPPGRPALVVPAWARAAAAALGGASGVITDTLSIATRGLDTAHDLRAAATAKGYVVAAADAAGAWPFVVGDDPDGSPALPAPTVPGGRLSGHELAGVLRGARVLCVLNPVRAHPHLGVVGAVAALGLELAARDARLRLHAGIRPQVDTPLCAGCGSCLDVCLYDAIVIRAGRATIDHQKCTGCGECMGVCFMAGIAPDDAGGLRRFQEDVAEAAAAARLAVPSARGDVGGTLYLNLLVHLGAPATASKARRRLPLPGIGVLASRDPVAVDTAAFACLEEGLGAPLAEWSGYAQGPGALLARAESLGLGRRAYRMREV